MRNTADDPRPLIPWEERRAEIIEAWNSITGSPARDLDEEVQGFRHEQPDVIDFSDEGDYTRERLTYTVETGERVEAWLCRPRPLPEAPLPGVLVLQGSYALNQVRFRLMMRDRKKSSRAIKFPNERVGSASNSSQTSVAEYNGP